jgi:hypothetical protein
LAARIVGKLVIRPEYIFVLGFVLGFERRTSLLLELALDDLGWFTPVRFIGKLAWFITLSLRRFFEIRDSPKTKVSNDTSGMKNERTR